MTRSFDTVIVGGGLIGLAVGYGLASRGMRVALCDEGDRAFRAARGNFGLVWIQSKGSTYRPYAAWSRRSAGLWDDFAREIQDVSGIDVELRWGGLHLCHNEAELAARTQLMRLQFDSDLPAANAYEMLDRRGVTDMQPQVGPEVIGASYGHLDGHINPLRLLRALLLAYTRRGGTYLANCRVTAIEATGEGYSLTAGDSRVSAAKVVLAAGLGNTALGAMVGIDLPIHPLRGQVLVTERQPQWLTTTTHIVRQMEEGTVVIGDSQEDAGYDDRTVLGVMGNIAARAVKSFPHLARSNVVRAWSCLRIMTRDGVPVYEQSQTHPGAFAFAVHSGVTLGAVHARVLAQAVADGKLGPELAPFSGARFAIQKPHERAA